MNPVAKQVAEARGYKDLRDRLDNSVRRIESLSRSVPRVAASAAVDLYYHARETWFEINQQRAEDIQECNSSGCTAEPSKRRVPIRPVARRGLLEPRDQAAPLELDPDTEEFDAWDPDWYLALAIEPLIAGKVVLADRTPDRLMIAALAVLLAADRDRGRLLDLMTTSGIDAEQLVVAGKTRSLSDLIFSGCSPVRWWLLCRLKLAAPEAVVGHEGWVHEGIRSLDEDLATLGEGIIELLDQAQSGATKYIDEGMAALAKTELGLGISDLARQLEATGFANTKKTREALSRQLRGLDPLPGTRVRIALASTVEKRLRPIEGWQERLDVALGRVRRAHRAPSPF